MLLVVVVGCGDCGVLYMRVLFDLIVNCLFLVCWLRSCCGLILVLVLCGCVAVWRVWLVYCFANLEVGVGLVCLVCLVCLVICHFGCLFSCVCGLCVVLLIVFTIYCDVLIVLVSLCSSGVLCVFVVYYVC